MHVPFEHNQFLHRLDALGYRVSDEARIFQLKDTATVLGELLGTVPGLTAEANKQNSDAEPLTHLRLIIYGFRASPAAVRACDFASRASGRRPASAVSITNADLPDARGTSRL